MSEQKFEVAQYTTGERKNVNYAEMGEKYHLTAEQVRDIAIARATARVKNNEEIVTISEDTKGKLAVVKMNVKHPERIIISNDKFADIDETKIMQYNHQQMKLFEKNQKLIIHGKIIATPKTEDGKKILEKFKELYSSDIYDTKSIDIVRDIQGMLKLEGKDKDGKFGPNTQKKLIEAIMNPNSAPAASVTSPAASVPAPAASAEKKILDTNQSEKII